MRKYMFVFIILVILLIFIFYTFSNNEISVKPNLKLSVNEAEQLIRDYIIKDNPNMNPEAKFPLIETTTNEIYSKLHAQVYKVTDGSHMKGQDYIIKDGIINALGSYWGGNGITDMKVIDLNRDGRFELLYHFYTGSGVSRLVEGIYFGPNKIEEKVIKTIQ
ncbi:MAG: hypothetical protein ACOZCL_10535 [Bacillota bacterium]